MPPAPTHGLLYRSVATAPISSDDLLAILVASRRWNAQNGVTGRLFVEEADDACGAFVQWIEGPEEALGRLFRRIAEDPRHADLSVMASGPIGELAARPGRLYPDWSMSLERAEALPSSVGEFLTAYEDQPERRLVPEWTAAA